MAEAVRVSKQFAEDFELVATHYRLKELGEYEISKECARRDPENAAISFALMASEIKQ